jgi:hypothetical protein
VLKFYIKGLPIYFICSFIGQTSAMKKKLLFSIPLFLIIYSSAISQQKKSDKDIIIPYAGFMAGGCDVSIPFSFVAGIRQVKNSHFSILYDIHYWNTKYECYCDDTYSKGHFSSITPSVKLAFSTGKKEGKGVFTAIGLGYMIAKDRGTEQSYVPGSTTSEAIVGKDIVKGKWDFTSIAPSVAVGINFRAFHHPFAISNTYYFAKTTSGWEPVTGGAGISIGFKKID